MTQTFWLNGRLVTVKVGGAVPLATVLREHLGLTGTKVACGQGACGSCTVLVGGRPILSCVLPVAMADDVETIEGLADESLSFREAMAAHGGFQCGFCTPGVVVACCSLLRGGEPLPDEVGLRRSLGGNICRCTGYEPIVAALRQSVEARADRMRQ